MAIEVNKTGFEYAKRLIESGRVVIDEPGDWEKNLPDTEEQNRFIKESGMEAYAQWHLGVEKGASDENKGTYSFPYGDYEKVYRSGLIAAEQRAAQYHHGAVEQAAKDLLGMIPKKESSK